MANRLRKHSLISTSRAGSGHPSSCLSCAELISALFFHFLRFEVANPKHPANDRLILSKGHAAPILWAAWAEAGAFPLDKLLTLRNIDSDLEGHPTPRNPWVEVATGSLGQGLSVGVGMALAAKLNNTGNRVFVLLGDGETAEGSVWEAAAMASHYSLENMVALWDINRFGQSQTTMYQHDVDLYSKRLQAFGWHTQIIDGHNVNEILDSIESALAETQFPSAILARTLKGKGVSFMENRDGWHGKPIDTEEALKRALEEIGDDLELERPLQVRTPQTGSGILSKTLPTKFSLEKPVYAENDQVATRQAYGTALQKLGKVNQSVVVLDGDTKNSTYSDKFLQQHPDRFFECFIAEQNMVGVATGLSTFGKIPFASSFAAFLSRAYDQIRMAGVSQSNIKLCGSHAGISIGEDGPSQMGLEDLAMMRALPGSTVLYPADAVCTERLVQLAAEIQGLCYIRTSRPKTPILYGDTEEFSIGGCKVLKSSVEDEITVVAAGITLHEALKAYTELLAQNLKIRVIDLYSIKPLDVKTLHQAAQETRALVTVEDHYAEGGLGDAVLSALADKPCRLRKLAVTSLPRSGRGNELLETFKISARHIVQAVKDLAR